MDLETMAAQFDRLRARFGDKAFDKEFIALAMREVSTMHPHDFTRFVDVMIGSRPHSKPPLLSEFREARLQAEKMKHQQELRQAVETFNHPAKSDGLRRFLAMNYPGAKTLWEAVQIQVLRNQVERANRGEQV